MMSPDYNRPRVIEQFRRAVRHVGSRVAHGLGKSYDYVLSLRDLKEIHQERNSPEYRRLRAENERAIRALHQDPVALAERVEQLRSMGATDTQNRRGLRLDPNRRI